MQWKKPSAELSAQLENALAPFECEKRTMFGMPAYFINGAMFAGVHQDSLVLRLSEADRQEIMATYAEAAPFVPVEGRPMREYVVIPQSLAADGEAFRAWLSRSRDHAATLPPKPPKRPRKRRLQQGRA